MVNRAPVIAQRLLQYLTRHPSGLSSNQMWEWTRSRKEEFTLAEYDAALVILRADQRIACTNGLWWIRNNSGW